MCSPLRAMAHLHLRGPRVLADVGQRLLHDAEHGRRIGLGQFQLLVDVQLARDAGALRRSSAPAIRSRAPGPGRPASTAAGRRRCGASPPRWRRASPASRSSLRLRRRRRRRRFVPHPDGVHLQRGERLRQLVVQFAGDAALLLLARSPSASAGEGRSVLLGAAPARSRRAGSPCRTCPRPFELRDRGIDRELLAVCCASPWITRVVAHAARGDARGAEAPDMLAMRRPRKRSGISMSSGRAHHLLARPAEHLLGGLVEQHDVLLLVHGDDAVHRRIEHARQPRRSAHCSCSARAAAVTSRRITVSSLPLARLHLRYRRLDRELFAVGAQAVDHGRCRSCGARSRRFRRSAAHGPACGAGTLGNQHG